MLCFALAYVLALFNSCPVYCNLALLGSLLYLVLLLVHRYLSVTCNYLMETKDLTHVPQDKIRRQRFRMAAVLMLFICLAFLPAVLTAGSRTYRDLRFFEFYHTISPEDLRFQTENEPQMNFMTQWQGEFEEIHETPAWVLQLEKVIPVGMAVVIIILLIRLIRSFSRSFRGIPEENGDIARVLHTDETRKLSSSGGFFRREPLTEREKIRKQYRQTIRRYRGRKNLPKPWETPSQIEAGTDFPEGFDIRELHEAYEKARFDR